MVSKLLLAIVFVLDLIAFALAVAAEQRRSTAKVQTDPNNSKYCHYDKDIATGLGVGSLLLLTASQILIMAVARCLCCGRPLQPGRARVRTIVFFITCWVVFFIAEVCLLAGSVRNAYHTKYRTYFSDNPPSCETLRKGVFGAGAAFIVFTGILSGLFYVSYSRSSDGLAPGSRDTGIRMGSI
ncbi:uncharacterized protein LOC127254641 [Andrographis paniculata]|uniref:uncharacterized protein LOC127254641 n=1 Tax=Andrographis paniculata TaxID=175694 RepID=UPI0021E8BCF3|nr:uncharacterized protein LOC127254641 [Andrographis paniculata]XP_051135816.1 uncharacterized protein LOC127254641 [Andrographis paniculata]